MRRTRMTRAAAAAVLYVGDGDVRWSSVDCRPNRILAQPQIYHCKEADRPRENRAAILVMRSSRRPPATISSSIYCE
ncbi:hypothetical protein MUK42_22960 [Musa troglodytarum]|uniref:Uncharacterized protein n=1 Tax=Musa troglodytarum TaxID=320322 RepID=A0A9E7G8I5_9LILI|nr:hypothetical protein MUK42_22960 [Musa troglodytarum]